MSWKTQAASDRDFGDTAVQIIDACIREVQQMKPAPTSEMSFEGGKRRALSVLKKFREEVKPK